MTRHLDPGTCLPHRAPALILESVCVLPDHEIESRFTVRAGTHYVEDDRLCLGGLVESMAQAAAAHLGLEQIGRREPVPGLLVGLEDLEVSRLPRTGENIRVRCDNPMRYGPLLRVRAEAWSDEESCARGVLKVFTPENSGEAE